MDAAGAMLHGTDQAVSWPLFALQRSNPRAAYESNTPIVLVFGLPFAAQLHFAEIGGTRPACLVPRLTVPFVKPEIHP